MTRSQEELAVLDAVAATAGESGTGVPAVVRDANLRLDHELSGTAIACVLATLDDDGLIAAESAATGTVYRLTDDGHAVAEREVHTP